VVPLEVHAIVDNSAVRCDSADESRRSNAEDQDPLKMVISGRRRLAPQVSLVLVLLGHVVAAKAQLTAVTVYADCSAAHIPARNREESDWVKVRRCENLVVNSVRGLAWPLQVPSQTRWLGGFTTNSTLICPTDPTSFDKERLVDFFLRYWDQKGIGYISGTMQPAQDAVVEAFTAQFADCANKGK